MPLSIFLSFTSGGAGEGELGWRGYMREEFNKNIIFKILSIYQRPSLVFLAYTSVGC